MATDREIVKKVQVGQLASAGLSSSANTIAEVGKVHRRTYTWRKDAKDTNATDNTAELTVAYVANKSKIVQCKWASDVNVAAHNTNTIQLTVQTRDGAGGNAVVACNGITTVAGLNGFTLWQPKTIPIITTANADVVAAGSVITFQALKANSGTALDLGILTLVLEEI